MRSYSEAFTFRLMVFFSLFTLAGIVSPEFKSFIYVLIIHPIVESVFPENPETSDYFLTILERLRSEMNVERVLSFVVFFGNFSLFALFNLPTLFYILDKRGGISSVSGAISSVSGSSTSLPTPTQSPRQTVEIDGRKMYRQSLTWSVLDDILFPKLSKMHSFLTTDMLRALVGHVYDYNTLSAYSDEEAWRNSLIQNPEVEIPKDVSSEEFVSDCAMVVNSVLFTYHHEARLPGEVTGKHAPVLFKAKEWKRREIAHFLFHHLSKYHPEMTVHQVWNLTEGIENYETLARLLSPDFWQVRLDAVFAPEAAPLTLAQHCYTIIEDLVLPPKQSGLIELLPIFGLSFGVLLPWVVIENPQRTYFAILIYEVIASTVLTMAIVAHFPARYETWLRSEISTASTLTPMWRKMYGTISSFMSALGMRKKTNVFI